MVMQGYKQTEIGMVPVKWSVSDYMPQWQERKKLLNESKLDYMDSDFEE